MLYTHHLICCYQMSIMVTYLRCLHITPYHQIKDKNQEGVLSYICNHYRRYVNDMSSLIQAYLELQSGPTYFCPESYICHHFCPSYFHRCDYQI